LDRARPPLGGSVDLERRRSPTSGGARGRVGGRSVEAAIQRALDEVCAYTGWPIGHVYLATTDRPQELVPTTLWHLDEPERFVTFRTVTEATRFPLGIGLPGRVFLEQKPA